MIIVTTKGGTHLINDAEVSHIIHDKENAKVYAYGDTFGELEIEGVTDIYYTANAPIEWRDKGNAFLEKEKQIEQLKEELTRSGNAAHHFRWAYMRYDYALSEILAVCQDKSLSDEWARKRAVEYAGQIIESVKKEYEDRKAKGQL